LQAAGVEVGDRVALLTKNCAECFELMFACNKIGAILTSLNWRLAPTEIESIVADAMPTVIITSPQEAHLLTPTAQQQASVRHLITLGEPYQQWRVSAGDSDPGHEGAPDEVALLL
jgi:acyl-CoA synthetase (AMP-forming)/AMP-acid ligase II